MSAPTTDAPAPLATRPFEVIERMQPGSPEWLQVMSASKVSAILGLSPFESRFALWHRMNGSIPRQAEKPEMNRGHYVEPAIAAWYADQHPELTVVDVKETYRSIERPNQVASPDRMLHDPTTGALVTALECKSDGGHDWEWGPEGTDRIPLGYRCQVMWTMDVLGLDHMVVAALTPYLTFRSYRVDYDAEDAQMLRDAATEFMDSLAAGTPPRPDDGSDITYEAVRQLSPGIEDTEVEIDDEIATEWVAALVAQQQADRRANAAKARIAQAMGTARKATSGHTTLATRQTRGGGTPFVVVGRGLIEKGN